jgi:hypothetical protein
VTLFVGLGSPVGELTLAALVRRAGGRCRDGHDYVADLTAGQGAQTPADHAAVVEASVAARGSQTSHLAGKESVTTTLPALDGPKFVTEIV